MSDGLLQNSHGNRPRIVQDDIFPEGIAAIDFAAEAGTLLVGTNAGHLTLLNSSGELIRTARNYSGLRKLAWSGTGQFGAAVQGDNSLVCFGNDLKPVWDVQFTGNIVGLAVSPYGSHLAVSSDSSRTHIVTTERKEVARFESPRPLDFLHFLHEKPQLLGAAEFGHLCCHELDGNEVWEERIMNNVGGMSVSGCGRRILLAAFNHGIQVLNSYGKQRGAFMIDGIPGSVSAATIKNRLAATTLESRVYWLNFEGELIWAADLSQDPPQHILAGPLADRLFLTTQSGRLLQLAWA
ncbi:MAG: hypothetical protein R3C19_00735 [Planctomycetaceae bacterium]